MIYTLFLLIISFFTPCQEDLEGAWDLVSWTAEVEGKTILPYGEEPYGFLSYEEQGEMTLLLMKKERTQEDFDNQMGFFAYRAKYQVSCQEQFVTHQVIACSHPAWNGKDQQRFFQLDGDTLILKSPSLKTSSTKDKEAVHTLKWIKSN